MPPNSFSIHDALAESLIEVIASIVAEGVSNIYSS
jgi:hypothetical protein